MTLYRLLTAAAAVSLIAGAAAAQTPATATTEKAAQAATGKPTSDAPGKTAVQGTARAVGEAAVNAQTTTPAATPVNLKANGDIMTTLRTSGQFNTFVKALDATNLSSLLQRQPNITVFAPTDAAFAALPPGELDKMMADKPGLQKLLIYHLINARIDSTKIKGARGPVPSGAGDKIVLDGSAEGGALKAENANIIQTDVAASNGLIQVVDQVLKPGSVPEANPEPPPAPEAAAPPPEPEKPAAKPPAKRKK